MDKLSIYNIIKEGDKKEGRMGKRGFTLIELLIVIIIIGVLAALAVPQYTGFVEKARAAEALAMISAIKIAEAAYKLESTDGLYTTTIGKLSLSNVPTNTASAAAMGQYWWYAVTGATSVKYLVTATRGTKAGGVASTISFAWSDTTGATWGGDHVGKPK